MTDTSETERLEEICPDCDGSGDILRDGEWEDCDWCGGKGLIYAPLEES